MLSLDIPRVSAKPESREENLVRSFKLAEKWGAVVLVPDADIFVGFGRTDYVAAFLRASTFFKGILILTSRRILDIDPVVKSRINAQIHCPHFDDEKRTRLWGDFFQKLEADTDMNMSVTEEVRDYIKSEEVQGLEWNGKEIKSGKKPLIHRQKQ